VGGAPRSAFDAAGNLRSAPQPKGIPRQDGEIKLSESPPPVRPGIDVTAGPLGDPAAGRPRTEAGVAAHNAAIRAKTKVREPQAEEPSGSEGGHDGP
jgi:hypothetical protein